VFPKHGGGYGKPDGCMGILPPIFPDAGIILLDIARVLFCFIEGRGKKKRYPFLFYDEVAPGGIEGAPGPLDVRRLDMMLQDWLMESILHSVSSLVPSLEPSS